MSWKWSEAGRLRDGEPYQEYNSDSTQEYQSIKGSFTWAKNVVPDYIWFNGSADHYLLGDTIKSDPIQMNTLYGSHDDKDSKIIPVKIHVGDQIYDTKHRILIQPKVFSENKGDSAYWKDFDWQLAATAGMRRVGLPFSGEYDFIETVMYWPVNHMVAPKGEALGCAECHTRENGRLASLTGFYLPGRDYNKRLDFLGGFLFFASLVSVILHGAFRVVASIRQKKYAMSIIDYDESNHGN